MTERSEEEAAKEAIKDEAVAWFVRMRGPDASQLEREFQAWYDASPLHAQSYGWAAQHFAQANLLKLSVRGQSRTLPRLMKRTRSAVSALPVARHTPRIWTTGALCPKSSRKGAGLSATALLAIIALVQWSGPRLPAKDPAAYPAAAMVNLALSTSHGEIRAFHLPDGTTLTLDADSRVRVNMNGTIRRFSLERGKARVALASGPLPFSITAGAGEITAAGATLDLRLDDDGAVTVRLISGKANIAGRADDSTVIAAPRPLVTDNVFAFRASDFRPLLPEREKGLVLDAEWPSGWVEYRSIPLAQLTAEANRYAVSPIMIDDPRIANLTVSGRFHLTDTQAFSSRIADLFTLDLVRESDGIHLRARKIMR